MIGALLSFFAVGLVTLVVAGVVLAVVGTVFTLAFALIPLLLKVGVIMLIGWGILKAIDSRNSRRLSAADRQWLERGD
jgi:MFS superfamily sulfate permease-like transporter